MDWYEEIENVSNKQQFLEFINSLSADYKEHRGEWENKSIDLYLEGIGDWVEVMEYYFKNTGLDTPENINWNLLALMLYIGKIYE